MYVCVCVCVCVSYDYSLMHGRHQFENYTALSK